MIMISVISKYVVKYLVNNAVGDRIGLNFFHRKSNAITTKLHVVHLYNILLRRMANNSFLKYCGNTDNFDIVTLLYKTGPLQVCAP